MKRVIKGKRTSHYLRSKKLQLVLGDVSLRLHVINNNKKEKEKEKKPSRQKNRPPSNHRKRLQLS